jgi:hypothetical protein
MPVMGFNITHLGEDNMTMNYTTEFYDPYMLGLLKRRQDKLFIHMKWNLFDVEGFFVDTNFNQMVLGNASLTRFFPEICQKDKEQSEIEGDFYINRKQIFKRIVIPLQFDFRSKYYVCINFNRIPFL